MSMFEPLLEAEPPSSTTDELGLGKTLSVVVPTSVVEKVVVSVRSIVRVTDRVEAIPVLVTKREEEDDRVLRIVRDDETNEELRAVGLVELANVRVVDSGVREDAVSVSLVSVGTGAAERVSVTVPVSVVSSCARVVIRIISAPVGASSSAAAGGRSSSKSGANRRVNQRSGSWLRGHQSPA